MQPLIYAPNYWHSDQPKEAERLRKSIKSSLEAIQQTYVTDLLTYFDVAHFLNYVDLKKIKDVKRNNIPVVVSALYCETERETTMVNLRGDKRVLKDKVRKCLNEADLVLVPGRSSKEFLEQEGVESDIKIFPLPINLQRFVMKSRHDKELFMKGFSIRKNTPYVLCFGDYLNQKDMENLIEIAGLAHFAKFYFLGANYSPILAGKYLRLAPENVVLSTLLEEDIYRSGLANAKIFLILNPSKIEGISCLEAMASKTQVVAYVKDMKKPTFLKDGVNCYAKKGINELVDTLDRILKGKNKSTTTNAYKLVLNYNLNKSGERLANIYRSLIREKKHHA